MRVSNLIYKASKKFNIPAEIYTAIIMQESAYRLAAKNIQCGLDKETRTVYRCVLADIGIAQINSRTAEVYGFDLYLLLNDLEYSINAGAEVLSYFKKRFAKKEPDFWVRYNCGTRSTTKRLTCMRYKELVSRYFQ